MEQLMQIIRWIAGVDFYYVIVHFGVMLDLSLGSVDSGNLGLKQGP